MARGEGDCFNPRSPCGERPEALAGRTATIWKFQSTLPVWGATPRIEPWRRGTSSFNPRSPCGERLGWLVSDIRSNQVSIHAPRVGSDCVDMAARYYEAMFQSTLPVWGATTYKKEPGTYIVFQSTLPVWGATGELVRGPLSGTVSIHAPRVGSDSQEKTYCSSGLLRFNPRSPCGERLSPQTQALENPRCFNPRSPCGERRRLWPEENRSWRCFNPRSPCGERRGLRRENWTLRDVSIHAPRVGSDDAQHVIAPVRECFNPRSPCGERRCGTLMYRCVSVFQSTLPVWGATIERIDAQGSSKFQSTLPVWGATHA